MSFLSPCYKPSHSSIHITKNKVHAKNLVLTEVCTHSPPTHIHTDKEQFLQHNYNVCRHSAFLMVVMEISLIRWRKCSFLSAHKFKKKKSFVANFTINKPLLNQTPFDERTCCCYSASPCAFIFVNLPCFLSLCNCCCCCCSDGLTIS